MPKYQISKAYYFYLIEFFYTGSYSIKCTGELTVDQTMISIGSNLTVHCRSNTKQCGRVFIILLDQVEVLNQSSCSSVVTQIVLWQPKASIQCLTLQNGKQYLVCGRDLVANRKSYFYSILVFWSHQSESDDWLDGLFI